ncbi:hypothetical protein [Streptomyces sp. V1I1]|uniref:hypothetical protein n=1 Tax=Streptomyces sp. V1I1 TaxID=3042272 RepID=UPI0027880AD9|nr:hypothetical protein [Streptomyces sp. V1I1]MDQ0943304.1 hypothetical protein [Streptomyces sp. V1I1]
MLTTQTVRTNPHLTDDQAAHIVALWTAAYPAMRETLDTVIHAQRGADRRTVDIPRLERTRRALGQIDRGTYRPCTRSTPAFSPTSAYFLVRNVLNVTSLGSPHVGAIHRLAAELADLSAAASTRHAA